MEVTMRKYFFVLLIFSSLLIGCGNSGKKWTNEEKDNIEHFLKSGEASRAAVRISNSGDPYKVVPKVEMDKINDLRYLALSEAKLVRDDVLAKAHPDLPKKFRNLYQKSLELRIENVKNGNFKLELKGSKLHDSWVDWINANNKKIKIPK